MKKWKMLIAVILIVLVVSTLIICFTRIGNFSKVSGIGSSQIYKITVQTDWGENKTITSKDDIQKIIAVLNTSNYSKNMLQPDYLGYLYNIDFYYANNKTANVIIGDYPIINGKKYKAKVNISGIEKIIGLYPPGK